MKEEPSVLDYVIAILTPWRGAPPPIPPLEPSPDFTVGIEGGDEREGTLAVLAPGATHAQDLFTWIRRLPWVIIAGLILALAGQSSMEPPARDWVQGIFFYSLSAICWVIFLYRDKNVITGDQSVSAPPEEEHPSEFSYRPNAAVIAAVFSLIAFVAFGDNLFTPINVLFWVLGIGGWIYALWQSEPRNFSWSRFWEQIRTSQGVRLFLSWPVLCLLGILIIAGFFRFYQLNEVPPEMFSDHAEKLLDVYDVMHGEPHIFFPRNTGREADQMYLTAAIISLFNTGYSFISLKLGTTLLGFLTLPYLYLIAKELTNRRAALFALFFAGIAYWPNVINRVALRFALYPFFTAPALYYLIRGLRYRRLNDFILAGLFLGLGLQGYSTMRIVPFIFVIAIFIYLIHRQSAGWKKGALYGLVILTLLSMVAFLPLLRYSIENPESVSYRALTRLGTAERNLPGSPAAIFLDNFQKAMVMFFWDNGEIWVHSLPHRPALDIVSAALLVGGILLFVFRYIRRRDWTDLFLLLSIPLFMMPSILSIAFPAENPSLNRTGAAIMPVFILIGYAIDTIMSALSKPLSEEVHPGTAPRRAGFLAWMVILVLCIWSVLQNYDLVFRQYYDLFRQSAWNTSEMGQVIRNFADTIGGENQAWVIAYPHWVDTRLVGMNAGFPKHDYGVWPDDLNTTVGEKRVKMFLVKPDDTQGLQVLSTLYPQGVKQLYKSHVDTKDFYVFLVPPLSQGGMNNP